MTASRTWRPLGLLLAAGLALAPACTKRVDTAPEPAPAEPAAVDDAAPRADTGEPANRVVVSLVEPGAEPLRQLRYAYTEGQTEELVMTIKMSMSTEMMGGMVQDIAMPPYHTYLTLRVVEINDVGDTKTAYEVTKIEVDDEGFDPMLSGMLTPELQKMVGLSGWTRTSDKGALLESHIESYGGLAEGDSSNLDHLNQSLSQANVAFPEEAVGVGGSWRAQTTIDAKPLTIRQSSLYTLESLDDDGGTLSITLSQTADPQDLPPPENMPDAKIHLTSMTGESSGEIHFSFKSPSTQLTTTMALVLEMSTEAMGMNVDTRVRTHMDMSMSTAH